MARPRKRQSRLNTTATARRIRPSRMKAGEPLADRAQHQPKIHPLRRHEAAGETDVGATGATVLIRVRLVQRAASTGP